MIHLLCSPATAEQLTEMLEELTEYVKLAVDIKRGVVAGGGELHADCETIRDRVNVIVSRLFEGI